MVQKGDQWGGNKGGPFVEHHVEEWRGWPATPSRVGTGCKSLLGPSSARPKLGWLEVLASTRQPGWPHCSGEGGITCFGGQPRGQALHYGSGLFNPFLPMCNFPQDRVSLALYPFSLTSPTVHNKARGQNEKLLHNFEFEIIKEL